MIRLGNKDRSLICDGYCDSGGVVEDRHADNGLGSLKRRGWECVKSWESDVMWGWCVVGEGWAGMVLGAWMPLLTPREVRYRDGIPIMGVVTRRYGLRIVYIMSILTVIWLVILHRC